MAERGHRNSGVTATDVARRAGVSQSTVSRVLNPNGKVKVQEEARQRGLTVLRGDTHRDNKVMQRVMEKNGLEYRGIIYLEDGGERLAYEKLLK